MSAKIEYKDGFFHIHIPAGEAYQDENLKRFLDTYPAKNDFSRPASSSELGDDEDRRWWAENQDWYNDELD